MITGPIYKYIRPEFCVRGCEPARAISHPRYICNHSSLK